jgi:hypothetical protein
MYRSNKKDAAADETEKIDFPFGSVTSYRFSWLLSSKLQEPKILGPALVQITTTNNIFPPLTFKIPDC